MSRVIWHAWTPEHTAYDIERLQAIGLDWHSYYDSHLRGGDIRLTIDGQNYPNHLVFPFEPCAGLRTTYYSDTYQYLQNEYNSFPSDTKWDHRFVINPDYSHYDNTTLINLPGYWEYDGKFKYPKKRNCLFGMVLTKREKKISPCDIGYIRSEFVEELKGYNFKYWGKGWDPADPNWEGESYRGFDKCLHSRELLSNCKFALALENSTFKGFTTEKFWNALAAGCLPVYIGPDSIQQLSPPEIYINANDFQSAKDVVEYCEDMSDREWRRRTELGFEFFLADKTHSWEAVFTSIDKKLQSLT